MESSALNWILPSYKNLKFGSNCCYGSMNKSYRLASREIPWLMMRSMNKSHTLASREVPWLTLLPDVSEGGDMVYKFYKLENGQVVSFPKRPKGVELVSDQVPPDDAKLVGSSHGWLASFDERTKHVYLSNPISGRHIKLPPITTLPDPDVNLFDGISRVILSRSPDENRCECRAITTFGPGRRLAHCIPGVSTKWTPMGNALQPIEDDSYIIFDNVKFAEPPKEDFVYCSGRRLLTSISTFELDLETNAYAGVTRIKDLHHTPQGAYSTMWDCNFSDPDLLHKRIRGATYEERSIGEGYHDQHFVEMLKKECIQMPHLLCASTLSREPLILLRFVNRGIGYNGSSCDPKLTRHDLYRARVHTFPYKTVCFLVLTAYRNCYRVVKDLQGLAIFVGMNHSFAIPAANSILKPNSIYFTDACRITSPDPKATKIYGGHDIGIFDYESKTTIPCYYPCDMQCFQRIEPPPMWFTPNPY